MAFAASAYNNHLQPNSPTLRKDEELYKKILIVLRAKTGHDFSLYKQNTIIRRVQRRMAVQQIERLDDYLAYLQQTLADNFTVAAGQAAQAMKPIHSYSTA